jgi:2,3-bisphosphoglycerate-independent phosphoglycerate mutase
MSGKAVGPIVDGDAVVTFNFRADRMVMLAKALEYADFDKFDRVVLQKSVMLGCSNMMASC